MWQLVNLYFTNLFSHVESNIQLKQGELTMIFGRVLDEEGFNSNGSGKSTIIEALTLGITGDVYRKVRKDFYIRTDQDECTVKVEFKHAVTKETFTIQRVIFSGKKSTLLNLYEEGVLLGQFDKRTDAAQEYIYEKLGVTEADLLNYYLIGQDNNNSFLNSTDLKQKEIINRFSNVSVLDKVLEKLSLDIKVKEADVSNIDLKILTSTNLKEHVQQDIESIYANNNLDKIDEMRDNYQGEIEQLKQRITQLNQQQANKKAELEHLTTQLQELEADKPDAESVATLKLEQKALSDEMQLSRTQLNEARQILTNLSENRGRVVTCPKCKFEFIPNGNMTPAEIEDMTQQVETLIFTLDEQIGEQGLAIETKGEQINSIRDYKSQYRTIKENIDSAKQTLESLETRQHVASESITAKLNIIASLKVDINQKLVDEKRCSIRKIEDQLITLQQQKEKVTQQKEALLFQQFHFDKKGFKTFLANKSIKNIQDITNFYLQKFASGLQIHISGYKTLKNGDVRDELEIYVLRNGVERGLYKRFSGGEKQRLDLCCILALQKLINNSSSTGGLDLLLLDEYTNNLDSRGQQEIVSILQQSKVTSALVMHLAEDLQCENTLTVIKDKSISKIK